MKWIAKWLLYLSEHKNSFVNIKSYKKGDCKNLIGYKIHALHIKVKML